MMRVLKSIHDELKNTNNEIKLLICVYGEVAKRLVTGNETLVQDIGNFLNQHLVNQIK